MNQNVVVKSYGNGISLHLDASADFQEILYEIAQKFYDARNFFKDIKVALSIEGRNTTIEEEKAIIQTIAKSCSIQILCLIGRNEDTNRSFIKALKRVDTQKEENNGKFYRGNLTGGQVLETEGSIIVIGNVLKGATVIATKDIVIIGVLQGEAYAGAGGEKGHFIVALQMEPEKCKIGSLHFEHHAKEKGLWNKRNKQNPQIAYESNQTLVVETITKELLEQMI